ncbi:MAG: response regulator [bacterium]|nr:response regulator [bacterium]
MKEHILVVEDEAAIQRGLVRSIDRDPLLRGTGAYTVDEAVAVLRSDPPDLLITDLSLPGRHGLEMITELDRAGLRIPIIIITAHRATYEQSIPRHGGIMVLEKPIALAVLLDHIHARLEAATSEALGPTFEVSDYLQLAGMGRHSVLLRVAVDGEDEAWLEIIDGDIWNAYFGQRTGEDAVAALLSLPAHNMTSKALTNRPRKRQIQRKTAGLLLDLARAQDEARRGEGGDGEPIAPSSTRSYADLVEEGIEAARCEHWKKAEAAFQTALEIRPDDARARYNLARIRKLLLAAAGNEGS